MNLDYKPEKVCKCIAEYKVDTEFKTGYEINLTESFVRCDKGQVELSNRQLRQVTEIIFWARENGE